MMAVPAQPSSALKTSEGSAQIELDDLIAHTLLVQRIRAIHDGLSTLHPLERSPLEDKVIFGANIVGVHGIGIFHIHDPRVRVKEVRISHHHVEILRDRRRHLRQHFEEGIGVDTLRWILGIPGTREFLRFAL